MAVGRMVIPRPAVSTNVVIGIAMEHGIWRPFGFQGCALTALEVQHLRGGFSFRNLRSSRSEAQRYMVEPYQGCALTD